MHGIASTFLQAIMAGVDELDRLRIRADYGRIVPQNCGINRPAWPSVETTKAGVWRLTNPEDFMVPR
jgi:hypothetical protein